MNYENAILNIRKELKTYIVSNNIKSLVLGISGGIDSCLCAVLAKPVCDELNIPLIGRSLPIVTNTRNEIDRAKITGQCFCTDFKEVDLTPYYTPLSQINFIKENSSELSKMNSDELSKIEKASKIRNGNIKARIRMIYLYNLASVYNGMTLSTDNYTEYMLGFWTLHGDVADYGMIQELWKSEVYDIAEWIANNQCKNSKEKEIILETINSLATDGLGVTDLGDLGQILPEWTGNSRDGYKKVDKILQLWQYNSSKDSIQKTLIAKSYEGNPVIKRHLDTEFKRKVPINISRKIILEK